jgi:protease I
VVFLAKAEGKRVLFIVAQENFRDEELFRTKEALDNAGAQTEIASSQKGTLSGALGGKAEAELSLDEVNTVEFDAIVFVGGSGSSVYFNDKTAQQIAKDAFSQGKVLAAICIAPSILANAGLLEGRRATCFQTEAENLKEKGVIFTGKDVETDGKIVTASGPEAAAKFGNAIAEAME